LDQRGRHDRLSKDILQEHAREYRASDNTRLAGGVINAHDVPSKEELVNLRGTASPSETSAVPLSLEDMISTPRRESEHETDAGQVISNDLVANRTDTIRELTRVVSSQTGLPRFGLFV
jgi:hypothetical protein